MRTNGVTIKAMDINVTSSLKLQSPEDTSALFVLGSGFYVCGGRVARFLEAFLRSSRTNPGDPRLVPAKTLVVSAMAPLSCSVSSLPFVLKAFICCVSFYSSCMEI